MGSPEQPDQKWEWYACWQQPQWFKPFRKGPLTKQAALCACQEQAVRKPMFLMWIESSTGETRLFNPFIKL